MVVRASVEVDPHTAQLTIASDPLPSIREGIPLDIRTLDLNIDRPGLIVNPTNCASRTVAGTIASAGGTHAAVSSPFQAVNCAQEPFRPRLLALTHARTSRADGAYLHVKVVSGPGQANIAKVKVDLPRQLPSRLTTLQHACEAKVFEADPAACPAASLVGTATVLTPMLSGALTGPAYLVSHGVAAFPSLVMVLQGEGVTIDLEGQMNISKGITSSAFRALPDTPIATLELVFPLGPHSAFGVDLPAKVKRGLCAQTLKMPTAIVGQNGVQIKQTTKIAVSGCRTHPPETQKGEASPSGGLNVWEVLRAVLAQHRADPGALLGGGRAKALQQLALALDRRVRDAPAHREALEQQLDPPLPGVLLSAGRSRVRSGEHLRVLAPRGWAEYAAQGQHGAVRVGVVAVRRAQLVAVVPALGGPAAISLTH